MEQQGTDVADILRAVIMCHESDEGYDGSTLTKKTDVFPSCPFTRRKGPLLGTMLKEV